MFLFQQKENTVKTVFCRIHTVPFLEAEYEKLRKCTMFFMESWGSSIPPPSPYYCVLNIRSFGEFPKAPFIAFETKHQLVSPTPLSHPTC